MVYKTYNFRAVLGLYCLAGLVIALLIHSIVLSSPKYNWIFPVTTASGDMTTVNPAPGAK